MADQLATPEDLASLLQQNVDTATAVLLIEGATAAVQAVVRQRLVQVVGDVAVLDLDDYDGGLYLDLPELPVTAVTTVAIGATTVTDYTTQLRRGRLWRPYGWRSTLIAYPAQPSRVTVTYTHGYATGDQRLQLARRAVLELAGAAYTDPSAGAVVREQIDDYSVQYASAAAGLEARPGLVAALRRQYGRGPRSVLLVNNG